MTEYSFLASPPPPAEPVPGEGSIVKDGTMFVPLDLANRDYQEFLTWVDEGNPAPEGWTGPTNDPPAPA